MNRKIGSVVACVVVIVICCFYYIGHIRNVAFSISMHYPIVEVEECSAGITDEAPEGYYVDHYGDNEDLADIEVVEVTWLLFNRTNNTVYIEDFQADYDDADGFNLYVMEKETGDLALPNYENKKVIPPAEHASLKEYVLVPKGMHEMEVTPGYMATGSARESFTITF